MTFFNKKEDVLEIELTQFGKYRLSQGELDPAYYAFFDDDIIYDGEYGGITSESDRGQNSIEPRIKDELRNRVQYVYAGIETEVARNIRLIRTGEFVSNGETVFLGKKDPNLKIFQPMNDTNFSSYAPLGTSDLTSDKAPAWNVSLFMGKLDNTTIQLTSSATALGMKIPQLEATIEYKTYISSPENEVAIAGATVGGCGKGVGGTPTMNTEASDNDTIQGLYQQDYDHVGITAEVYDEFPDDSYIEVTRDDFLLKVEEFNAPFTNENFDVEIFELTSSADIAGNAYQSWTPLYFRSEKDESDIYNNPNPKEWLSEQLLEEDSSYVAYFMEVNADRDIPEEILCPVLAVERKNNTDLYDTDTDIICPDLDLIRRSHQLGAGALEDGYDSTVKEEDIGDCD